MKIHDEKWGASPLPPPTQETLLVNFDFQQSLWILFEIMKKMCDKVVKKSSQYC